MNESPDSPPAFAYDLGIIGAGNMAEAIARGVIAKGVLSPGRIIAADVSPQRREVFEKELGVRAVEGNADVAGRSRNLLLSIKPQQMKEALAGIGAATSPRTLVVSIAAGISTAFIERHLGPSAQPWRVVRTMPNTPMLVGEGVAAMAAGAHATAADVADARRLFEAAATVLDVAEDQIDAVTAVSGSGPAYFFYFVEHLIRAGEALGLTPEQSRLLATRTALGAGRMLAASGDSPEELRRKVTSPKGTTEAAIAHLQHTRAGDLLVEAVHAAARRSKELGM